MSVEKPEVDFPEGAPPKDLEITDIWEGDGKVAGAGDTVKVHYVGVAFSSGEEFDASWSRGEPPQAGHPAAPRVRQPGRGPLHQAGGDPHLRLRPGLGLSLGRTHRQAPTFRSARQASTVATRASRETVVRPVRRPTDPARNPIVGGPSRKPV